MFSCVVISLIFMKSPPDEEGGAPAGTAESPERGPAEAPESLPRLSEQEVMSMPVKRMKKELNKRCASRRPATPAPPRRPFPPVPRAARPLSPTCSSPRRRNVRWGHLVAKSDIQRALIEAAGGGEGGGDRGDGGAAGGVDTLSDRPSWVKACYVEFVTLVVLVIGVMMIVQGALGIDDVHR